MNETCCKINCKTIAEWVIYEVDYEPYSEIHSCTQHVGELLSGKFNRVDTIDSVRPAQEEG
jgi:negative regulator of replication initiation